MATTERSRLRITTWPGVTIPEPPVAAVTGAVLEGDWVFQQIFQPRRPFSSAPHSLPPDLYLFELADVDLRDREQVRALAELGYWRSLGTHEGQAFTDLPIATEDQCQRLLAQAATAHDRSVPWDLERQRENLRRVRPYQGGIPLHVDEIALRVRVVKRLGDHAKLFAADKDVRLAWKDHGLSEQKAWQEFARYMNSALKPFHARVDDGSSVQLPSVFEVAVLQIFNDLTESATYRECANETCRRLFIRQRDSAAAGRSKGYYARAEGVRYCSRRCANEQTQRDYRRRKKAQKGPQ